MKPITAVTPGSPAERAGIRAGDGLLAVNGHEIVDALDYRFFGAEAGAVLTLSRGGETREVALDNGAYEDLGLSFETYLMDRHRTCRNNCVFCFVDQLPRGMRSSLYFKDDDERLSLLFGNYVTLTNLNEREFQRIIDLHISPINVSVHATDPEVRKKLMNNRFAGDVMEKLSRLCAAGLTVNAQLVVCPGLNDGEVLARSLRELLALGEQIHSIAVIPLGITCHREGLYPLTPVNGEHAREMIALCDRFGAEALAARGRRTVYAADELYVLSGLPRPDYDYYEDFPQLDNGVGMLAATEREFCDALDARRFPLFAKPLRVTAVTGMASEAFMQSLAERLRRKSHGRVAVRVIAVENRFFGRTVTVSGLLTGQDIAERLAGEPLGDRVVIPGNALKRDEDIFLDDMTLAGLGERLGVPTVSSGQGGAELLCALCGD